MNNETQTEPTNVTPEVVVAPEAVEAPEVVETPEAVDTPVDPEAAKIQADAAETHEIAQTALKFVMDKQGNVLTPQEVADATDRRSIDIH